MATWMKSELVSMTATLDQMKKDVSVIDDRIFTVQLYAGLTETLTRVKKGKPASDDAKVHVFQRRHYMDEECLARYEAGGMEFKDIHAFDKWLGRTENFSRILPFERSIVAFRVRRNPKYRSGIDGFVRMHLEKADKTTFLYIRNGQQLWRLNTEIDFGAELFPDRDSHELLSSNDALYVNVYWSDVRGIITERRYLELQEEQKAYEREKAEYTAMWNALSKEEQARRKKESGSNPEPYWKFYSSPMDQKRYERVDRDSVYYDDVMQKIAKETIEHNRVATVLQGLLDRSECLIPHPPWKIYTPEGFMAGIELVYDEANTLMPGDAPNFEAYRAQLALSIGVGSLTIGQDDAWARREAEKENAKERNRSNRRYGYGSDRERTHYRPHGNPGPGFNGKVGKMRGATCTYTWERRSEKGKEVWKDNPDRPGWGWKSKEYPMIEDSIAVPTSKLFCVSAYTPGDFHLFYDDPRTRAQYLKWAPFLLAAEDYHANPKKAEKFHGEIDLTVEDVEDETEDDTERED